MIFFFRHRLIQSDPRNQRRSPLQNVHCIPRLIGSFKYFPPRPPRPPPAPPPHESGRPCPRTPRRRSPGMFVSPLPPLLPPADLTAKIDDRVAKHWQANQVKPAIVADDAAF